MKGHNEQGMGVVVECAGCGRLYRAVGNGERPSTDDLTCNCGSNSFTERPGLAGVSTR